MFIEFAVASYLISSFIYHRWLEGPGKRPLVERQEMQIPKVDAGTMVPLIYGKCRVRQPVLAWQSEPNYSSIYFQSNMFFVLGIPFAEGRGTTRTIGMWAGDTKMTWSDPPPEQTGDGGAETPIFADALSLSSDLISEGAIETLNGNPSQVLANPGETYLDAVTYSGRMMLLDGLTVDEIPGYRGYASVMLMGSGQPKWIVGTTSSVPSYNFEVSSYSDTAYPELGTNAYSMVLGDANPADVIYDLLVSPQKLGVPASAIDATVFAAVRKTLWEEGSGFSYCFTEPRSAVDIINDVLKQIDGTVRNNPTTGKIELKLIRPDFDPSTIPHITKDNCVKLQGFSLGGWSNIPNAFDVVFSDRDQNYQDETVSYDNQANVAQHGSDRVILQYPGCTRRSLANVILQREVDARSRPMMKCRAIVDRSFLRVSVGDAVKLTWSKPDIAGVLFRVAAVDRGTLEDGAIALDLIQDVTYQWRNALVGPDHEAPELEIVLG